MLAATRSACQHRPTPWAAPRPQRAQARRRRPRTHLADAGGLDPGRHRLLVDQGIDSVRVDVLARRMGVTRGSFYWHFRDREDLLRSVLPPGAAAPPSRSPARFERDHTDPRELLHELFLLPFRGQSAERAARIELAIRAWARRDDMARAGRGRGRRQPHRLHRAGVLGTGFRHRRGAPARLPALRLRGGRVGAAPAGQLVEQLVQQPLAVAARAADANAPAKDASVSKPDAQR
jgi:AcrR family transcriptional regulator